MVKDNKLKDRPGFGGGFEGGNDPNSASSRARNRTVMLTPEMTGQVRALLGPDQGEKDLTPDPVEDLLPPVGWGSQEELEAGPSFSEGAGEPEELDKHSLDYQVQQSAKKATQGFTHDEHATVMANAPRHGETLHDMDSLHSKPAFTVNQGVVAAKPAVSSPSSLQPVHHKRKGKVIAFMVSYDNDRTGEVYEVSAGRWLITSKPTEHSDFILLEDDSVSALHAFIRATDNGKIQVLDQLSEFGTFVRAPGAENEEEITGAMVALEHGSMVRFGNRKFVLCLVPPMPEEK